MSEKPKSGVRLIAEERRRQRLDEPNIHRDLPSCGCGVGRVWGGQNFNGHSRDCAYRIAMVRALEGRRKYENYLEAEATIGQRFRAVPGAGACPRNDPREGRR